MLLVCDERARNSYIAPEQIERLESFADWDWHEATGGGIYEVGTMPNEWPSLRG